MKLPLKTAKALVEAWGDDRISVGVLAVDIRWYGESNGYYSESVDFREQE